MFKHLGLFFFTFLFIVSSVSFTPAMANTDSCHIFYKNQKRLGSSPQPPPLPPTKSAVKKTVETVVNFITGLWGRKVKPSVNNPPTNNPPPSQNSTHYTETVTTQAPPRPLGPKQPQPRPQPAPPPEVSKKKDKLAEEETKEYKAHNKDITEKMKRTDSSYLYGTTAPVPLSVVREAIFDVFDSKWTKSNALRTTEIPQSNTSLKKYHTLLVNDQEATKLLLPLPYGTKPSAKTYSEFKITQKNGDEYIIESLTSNPLPEKILVELQETGTEQMTPQQKMQLTKRSSIRSDEWPSHILDGIKKAKDYGNGDATKTSQILSEWFQFDGPYKYFSENGQKPAETIVEMAHLKEFNCDGGAQMGATLLRDFFGIPTRIADGRRTSGKKTIDNVDYNVVDYSLPAHVWVEIFDGKNWVPFDFTPTLANKELKENNHKEKLEPEEDPLERRIGKNDTPTEEKDKKQEQEQKQVIQNKPPQTKKEGQQENQKPPQKPAAKKTVEKPKFSKIPPDYKTPLALLARQALLQTLDAGRANKKWNELDLLLQGYLVENYAVQHHNQRAKSDLKKLTSNMYGLKEGTLTEMLVEAKSQIYVDPTVSYRYLKSIRDYFAEIGKLRELSEQEHTLLNELNAIMQEFSTMNHPNSKEDDLTKSIMRGLPGDIIKQIIRDQFPNVEKIGSVDQKAFVNAVMSGQMDKIMQASLVGKHFNFLLNAEREHKLRYAKSILRAYIQKNKNDDIVLARPEDIAKFDRWVLDIQYNPDPVMMLLDNLLKDQQYMMGYRQQYPTSGSQSAIERKHTNIFFDISGSMYGRPAEVQASAIAAIVDKALSEKDPYGNHIHKVILFPFGNSVHPGVHVTNAAEAKRVVLEHLSKPTDANEGTDIQACFDTHFAMIKDSLKASDPTSTDFSKRLKLNRANMILLTDGGGYVNKEKNLKELNDLPAYVRTMFNLVSIGGRNVTLEEVVQYTNTKNSKSMVTELTTDMMNEFAVESKRVNLDSEAFVYDKNAGPIEHQLISRINNLTMPEVKETIAGDELNSLITRIRRKDGAPDNARLISELLVVETLLTTANITDDMKLRFVTELIKNYQQLGGNDISELSVVEYSQLKKIIKLVRP